MKILVANRGEIACRILQTLREMGVPSVAVYTPVDASAPHLFMADEAVCLDAEAGYLSGAAILQAAAAVQATALHPGYGFLSQNADFAAACAQAGVNFIGPSPDAMRALGDKRMSRSVAQQHGIAVIPGATTCDTLHDAQAAAATVGFPLLLKAAGGGGGKGMRKVEAAQELAAAFAAAQREAQAAFADDRLLLERYIYPARHIEVQILADGQKAMALSERECSLQRRYQKIIEEAPACQLSLKTREALQAAAIRLCEAVGYRSAGTVEFLVDSAENFYFLEVNTRLQVEHPVTESICGMDLVRLQIEIAHGGSLPAQPQPRGHAIEARLNAEDAYAGFLPAVGTLAHLGWPQAPGVRVDAGVLEGQEITVQYDSMLAKIITWGADRESARRRLVCALQSLTCLGVTTNQSFLLEVLNSEFFIAGQTFTTTVEQRTWTAAAVPPSVAEAAQAAKAQGVEQDLTGGPQRQDGAGGQGDTYSPWESLGALRGLP
jgi:acetyl/propionyl-CoA carboxylase alpha subunit